MLNTLSEYSAAWNLNVNTSKTKIVVFRNRGKLQRRMYGCITMRYWIL